MTYPELGCYNEFISCLGQTSKSLTAHGHTMLHTVELLIAKEAWMKNKVLSVLITRKKFEEKRVSLSLMTGKNHGHFGNTSEETLQLMATFTMAVNSARSSKWATTNLQDWFEEYNSRNEQKSPDEILQPSCLKEISNKWLGAQYNNCTFNVYSAPPVIQGLHFFNSYIDCLIINFSFYPMFTIILCLNSKFFSVGKC